MSLVALTGMAMTHALGARVETASERMADAVALRAVFDRREYRPLAPYMDRRIALARAFVCYATGDVEGVASVLEPAPDAPPAGARNPDGLVARALRATALHQLGRPGARELLNEVLSLAELGGVRSYLETAHPAVGELFGTVRPAANGRTGPRSAGAAPLRTATPSEGGAVSGLLTPKEAHILTLLAGGLANKEIARAMDIGEQTVKWHLKNVFFKLNAASRRHAVDRARLLGLLSA